MSLNVLFEPFQDFYGFDKKASPQWQMVPVGGERKIYLSNAESMIVSVANPAVAQISEIKNDFNSQIHKKRLFTVSGNSYGDTFLEVRSNNVVKARLEIAVKRKKIVSLAFNFISDIKKRATKKDPSLVTGWMENLLQIYYPQTNIEVIHSSTNSIVINNNLGSEVDSVDTNLSSWEWDTIVSKGDKVADINVFFVWKIADCSTPGASYMPKGQTWKKDCFVSDYIPRAPEQELLAIAHEVGHALGIPAYQHFFKTSNRNRYVMYGGSRFTGREFAKIHINTMNP